jgi:glycosyltransferase involved in cell wall biosynthesis
LGRCRAIAQQIGVDKQIRFIPKFLKMREMAELMECADILVLPYTKHYGSGLLLLGMTFGKYILATDTGGNDEYFRLYSRGVLLEGCTKEHVVEGVYKLSKLCRCYDEVWPTSLEWRNIARLALAGLQGTQ